MATIKPDLHCLIARAAELRAAGEPWHEVARKLKRSASRLSHWPRVYRDAWTACTRAAEAHLWAQAASEALLMLRSLMRCEDRKIMLRAAELLMKIRQTDRLAELRAAEGVPAEDEELRIARLLEYLRHCGDQEMHRILRPDQQEPARPAPHTSPRETAADGPTQEADWSI